jgi:hypothetical protein
MLIRSASVRRICALILAAIGWFALGLQWHLTHALILGEGRSSIAAAGVYFGYFTILTNILAAACLSTLVRQASDRLIRFTAATAVYITVVGIVYTVFLRHIWSPQGMERLADALLHDAMPVCFVLFWLILVPKGKLRWTSLIPWLIYPLAYLGYTLLGGHFGLKYPYPFIDVTELGYGRVLFNSLGLTVGFLLLSLVFVAVDKLFARRVR